MGCDIHMMLAVHNKITDRYSPTVPQVALDGSTLHVDVPAYFRDYEVFGLLCEGVRGCGIEGVSLEERGKFPLERLSDWAQHVLKVYDTLEVDPDVRFKTLSAEYRIGAFLQDYYGTDDNLGCCHSHTYITSDHFELLETRLENKLLTVKNESLRTSDPENRAALDEWIDELERSRDFIRQIHTAYADLYEEISLGYFGDKSFKPDGWLVLVCFDS